MKTRRTLLALVLSVMMVIGLFPVTAMAEDNNYYLAYDAGNKTFVSTLIPNDIKEVSTTTTNWTDIDTNSGWYVVRKQGTGTENDTATTGIIIDQRVTVTGNVHLILEDGCYLTVNGGINVSGENSLTIYAQSTSEGTMGKLIAQNVTGEFGAIGSENNSLGGTITINGGSVQAVGSNGQNNSFGIRAINVTVNGGSVQAKGGDANYNSYGIATGNVTVNGGSVEAKGGNAKNNSNGIWANTDVTVNGGSVEAKGGQAGNSYGILADNVTVTGGSAVVFASSIPNWTTLSTPNGIVFEGNDGQVYGDATIPNGATLTVPNGAKLTIANGVTLTVAEGATLTNNGTIDNNGTIIVAGTVVGVTNDVVLYYPIEIASMDNGSVTVNASYKTEKYIAEKKDTSITLTVTPDAGYKMASLIVTDSSNQEISVTVGNRDYQFKMPAGNVTVSATFKKIKHTVDLSSVEHGQIRADRTSACAGDTVTLTATPDTGYHWDSWNVTGPNGENISVENDQFTMPAGNVTVSATFEKITYTVDLSSVEHGQISADRTSAQMGDTVKLTATPDTGYHWYSWNVTGPNGENISVVNDQFTMPAGNVTVSAVFEADVPVQPETPSEPEYIPIPDPDYTAPVYRDTWHKSGKNWYFYDEDGQKIKGWYKDGNTWYYLSEKTGAMVYGGMLEIDGETYYFYDWGGMASNWWYLDEETGDWYYFRGNGAMAKNTWIEWKGEWYYLGADGKMLTGTTTPDGYRVDVNGKWIR